jgi:hypothetical protein
MAEFSDLSVQARIETALAESAKEFRERPAVESPTRAERFAIPIDQAAHLLTLADTKYLVADRAVKTLGLGDYAVSVGEREIVVVRAEKAGREIDISPPADEV